MSVCLFVCPLAHLIERMSELHKMFLHVTCGRGSVLLYVMTMQCVMSFRCHVHTMGQMQMQAVLRYRRYINHLLTYLLTYLLIHRDSPGGAGGKVCCRRLCYVIGTTVYGCYMWICHLYVGCYSRSLTPVLPLFRLFRLYLRVRTRVL